MLANKIFQKSSIASCILFLFLSTQVIEVSARCIINVTKDKSGKWIDGKETCDVKRKGNDQILSIKTNEELFSYDKTPVSTFKEKSIFKSSKGEFFYFKESK